MTGQATSDIHGQGTVYVNGEEWTAISSRFIAAGTPIRVLGRRGLALEVEPLEN
jgi:membrane-bound serine protease (ClpP class)